MKKEVLLWCRSEDLNNEEVRLIAENDTFHNGLNCTIGGEFSPMLNPDVVAKVRHTWKVKFEASLEGVSDVKIRSRTRNRERQREARDQKSAGKYKLLSMEDINRRRKETWKLKRELEVESREQSRLAREAVRTKNMTPLEAATYQHNSKRARDARHAKASGNPLQDGRFMPSTRRHDTWRSKLEERIKDLSEYDKERARKKYNQRRQSKARMRVRAQTSTFA